MRKVTRLGLIWRWLVVLNVTLFKGRSARAPDALEFFYSTRKKGVKDGKAGVKPRAWQLHQHDHNTFRGMHQSKFILINAST